MSRCNDEPGGIRIVRVHQVFPDLHRQSVLRFFVPGDGRDLQCFVFALIEDGAAELEAKRQISVRDAMKVFCSGNVEIKRARHRRCRQARSP